VTPPVGTALAGYYVAEGRRSGARSTHDDLHAKALVFEHDGITAAVITSDLIAIPADVTSTVRAIVKEQTGIPDHCVMITASHNHSGPALSPPLRADLIAGLVAAAVREMRPARFAVGIGTCAINVNRRKRRPDGSWFGLPFLGQNFEGPVDHTVTVLRFERDDGSRAVLINYPCHAVVLGPNLEVSADYPGATQRFVEAYFGAGTLALFTNGAEGDINPIVHPGPFAEADRLGCILGAEVVKVAEQLTPRPVQRVAAAHGAVSLPVASSPPLEEEARLLAAWEARCRTLRASLSPDAVLDEEMSWTTAQLRHLRRRRFGTAATAEVQYIAIDDAVLASVAGELFTVLGQQVRASSPFAHTVLVGLANDSVGYIPPRSCFQEGGFEIEATPLEPGAGEKLRDAMISGLRALG